MELTDGRRFMLLDEARRESYITAWNALTEHRNLFPLFESPETTNSVLLAILDDNPGMFWFEGAWKIVPYGRLHVHPFYTCSKEIASRRTKELEGVLRDLRARIGATDSYHIALWLYDWMIENVRYGQSESSGQTSYDALVRRTALCKGMAKGYQLLLLQFGISSSLVRGSIGGEGKHVWNRLYIDSAPLYVDIALAHSQFDHLFPRDERDNPRRCFLMDRASVCSHQVVLEWEASDAGTGF